MTNPNVKLSRHRGISDSAFALLLICPALLVLGVTVLFPILKGIYVSFCDYKLSNLNAPVWNHFQNYSKLFRSGSIYRYFLNTFVYVILTVVIQFLLGMSVALLLNSKIRGRNILRGAFLIPWTLPSVVVAILWRWMLQQQFGVINYLIYRAGITDTINISWTTDSVLAMAAVVIAAVWRQFPYMMVMLLAALQSVDQSLIDAARVDGASYRKTLKHIVIPSIRPVIISAVWIATMSNFQMYTIIANMTGGGPVESTTTLSLAAYKAAFQSYDFGKGAAIGVLWLVILAVVTLISNKFSEKYAAD